MATFPRALRTEGAILARLHDGRSILLDAIRATLVKAVRGVVTVETAIGAVQRWLDPKAANKVLAGAPSRSRVPERVFGFLPGAAGYQARRILATETTRAHAEGRIRLAHERGYLLKWELAFSHPRIDECDSLATHDDGFGAGVYRPGNEPPCPSHPNCRCSYAVVEPDAGQLAVLREKRGF